MRSDTLNISATYSNIVQHSKHEQENSLNKKSYFNMLLCYEYIFC